MSIGDCRAALSALVRVLVLVAVAAAMSPTVSAATQSVGAKSPAGDSGIDGAWQPAFVLAQVAGCEDGRPGCVASGADKSDNGAYKGGLAGSESPRAKSRSPVTGLVEAIDSWIAWIIWVLMFVVCVALVLKLWQSDQQIRRLKEQINSRTGKVTSPLHEAAENSVASAKSNQPDAKGTVAPAAEVLSSASRNGATDRPLTGKFRQLGLAGSTIAGEALACLDQLESNRNFVELNEVAKIRDAVVGVNAKFKRLMEDNLTSEDDPVAILSAGGFNGILTICPLIDAYFSDQDDWYEMCRLLSALSEFTKVLLARYGVEVYVVKPLTRLGNYRGEKNTQDIRGIKKLVAVRAAVNRQAAIMRPGEALIVDCVAPGIIYTGGGSIPPTISFYNPSAWT
jgi:hypothetical protein